MVLAGGSVMKRPMDWAKWGMILFALLLTFIFFSDRLGLLGTTIGLSPIVIIIGLAIVGYILLWVIGFLRSGMPMNVQTFVLLLIVLGLIFATVWFFPDFSPYLGSIINP